MFRERIAHWSRILDLFSCTMSTVVVLARIRASSLLTRMDRSAETVAQPYIDTGVAWPSLTCKFQDSTAETSLPGKQN